MLGFKWPSWRSQTLVRWRLPIVRNEEAAQRESFWVRYPTDLVAPDCSILRDYLSDTPHIARYGVFGVSTWPIGCDTPSPFSERLRLPLGEHAKWRCDIPPTTGVPQRYSCDTL